MRYGNGMPEVSSTAGDLLREARTRAGLSQQELGRRAGVAQSVISVYEAGRRHPSLSTLRRLIGAAGFDLSVEVRPSRARLVELSGPVGQRVRQQRSEILRTASARGVSNLRVFGSVARGEDVPDSDVDLLVDLPAGMGLFGLARLQRELEEILQSRVDIVPTDGLRPEVRASLDPDLVRL